MTRVLVSIANFGSGQVSFMQRQIQTLRQGPFDLDIIVDSTADWSMDGVQVRRFDESIAKGLTFTHRKLFIDRREQYDLYLYLENDLLMPPAALEHWLDLTAKLPDDYITGFVRYEMKDGRQCLVDIGHPWHDRHIAVGLHKANNVLVFCPENVHAGCYALTRQQLERAIRSKGYVTRPHRRPYGVLEQGASDVYTQCGFRSKVLPFDFEPLLIHHMPDKYVSVDPRWRDVTHGHDVESYKRMLLEHDHAAALPRMTRPRYFVHDMKSRVRRVVQRVRSFF